MRQLEFVVARKYSLLSSDLMIKAYATPRYYQEVMLLPGGYVAMAYFFEKWYYEPKFGGFGDLLYRSELDEPGFLDRLFSNVYAYGDRLIEAAKAIYQTKATDLSTEELSATLNRFLDQYEQFTIALTGFALQVPIEAKLRQALQGRDTLDEDLAALTLPIKRNYVALEQEALLKLAAQLQKDGLTAEVIQQIDDHINQYGWLESWGGLNDPWNREQIIQRLRQATPRPEVDAAELQKRSTQLLTDLEADQELRRLSEIAKELVYFRTYRTEVLNMTFAFIREALRELGRRLGYSLDEVLCFRADELKTLQSVDKDELKQRTNGCAILTVNPEEVRFASDPKEIAQLMQECIIAEQAQGDQLKGNSAYRGVVVGKVTVVHGRADLDKLQDGDVLVTSMTTPNMVTAMHKASAFVTDEGGITCHAAIIARELRKPCIIGTKNATKLLKDGDMVEVDANSGIVRKI